MDEHDDEHFSAPLGAARSGVLAVRGVSDRLVLRALAEGAYREGPSLFDARFSGAPPSVRVDGGAVTMRFGWRFWPFDAGPRSGDIALSTAVPWQLRFFGGMNGLRADLRDVSLRALEIQGGSEDLDLALGRPTGTLRLRVQGGIDRLAIARPAGVPVRFILLGGASDVNVDTLHLDDVGGSASWESPGYDDAEDRLEIDLLGGVSHVSVRASAEGGDRAPADAILV